MFTSRSGRVTVEQQRDSVSISIRAAVSKRYIAFLAFCLLVFPIPPYLFPKPGSDLVLDELGSLVLLCALLGNVTWFFGGRYLIRISATQLQLSTTIFGIPIRQRVSLASEVRNLRFVPSIGLRPRKPSKIAFDDANGKASIPADLDELESKAVLDLMQTFQLFPNVSSRQSTR